MWIFDDRWTINEYGKELEKNNLIPGIGGGLSLLYGVQGLILRLISPKALIAENNLLISSDHLFCSNGEATGDLTYQPFSLGERWFS